MTAVWSGHLNLELLHRSDDEIIDDWGLSPIESKWSDTIYLDQAQNNADGWQVNQCDGSLENLFVRAIEPHACQESIWRVVHNDEKPATKKKEPPPPMNNSIRKRGRKPHAAKRAVNGGAAGENDIRRYQAYLERGRKLVCDRDGTCVPLRRRMKIFPNDAKDEAVLLLERWGDCHEVDKRKGNHCQSICHVCKAIFIDHFKCNHLRSWSSNGL